MTGVRRQRLGDGLSIARVVNGLGPTAPLVRSGGDLDQAALAMSPYVEAGLTSFDTGSHDGSPEEIAGMFGPRAERLIHWTPKPGLISRRDAREAVERSLTRLRAERIDLLQFHAASYANPSWLDALAALQDLKAEGLIGHIGVAHFDTAHLRIAVRSGIGIVSNQVSFSLLDTRASGALSDFCALNGVHLLACGTLLGGLLSDRWLGQPEPDWDSLASPSQVKYARLIRAAGGWDAFQQLLRRVDEVATKHGVPMSVVAVRAILDEAAVAAAIVGARLTKPGHIDDTLKVFALSLDDEDWLTLARGRKYLKPLPPGSTFPGSADPAVEDGSPPYPVKPGPRGRVLVAAGTAAEPGGGASRAHRLDDRIWVSATAAMHGTTPIGGRDAVAQFHFIVDKIEGILLSLGSSLADVVRTRVYLSNILDGEDVARAYAERFRSIQPANTLVRADLMGEDSLVEVEAEAVVTN